MRFTMAPLQVRHPRKHPTQDLQPSLVEAVAGVAETEFQAAGELKMATLQANRLARSPRSKWASDKKKASSEESAKEPPLCLNKSKCANQKHWMSKCPNSTEEEKKTLLDAYNTSKASRGSLNSLINSIQSSAHLNVTIGDNSYVAIADTGATHSAIDRPTVEPLRAAGVLIATKKLPRPMDLSLAISEAEKNRKQFSVTDVESVRLVLQMAAGRLAMRNVQMARVEQPMPFILLGELSQDVFRCDKASGLCEGNVSRVRLQYGEQVLV
jgi:hypothetical protein